MPMKKAKKAAPKKKAAKEEVVRLAAVGHDEGGERITPFVLFRRAADRARAARSRRRRRPRRSWAGPAGPGRASRVGVAHHQAEPCAPPASRGRSSCPRSPAFRQRSPASAPAANASASALCTPGVEDVEEARRRGAGRTSDRCGAARPARRARITRSASISPTVAPNITWIGSSSSARRGRAPRARRGATCRCSSASNVLETSALDQQPPLAAPPGVHDGVGAGRAAQGDDAPGDRAVERPAAQDGARSPR